MTSSSSQTRVSASSGRMSRRDAYDALQAIQAVAGTFPGHREAEAIIDDARAYLAELDTMMPAKVQILALQDALNSLVADRLLRSERATPDVHPATVVVLYGSEAQDTTRAFQIAAGTLRVPAERLALTDVSPVQTDRLSGSRWTIRVKMPHEK